MLWLLVSERVSSYDHDGNGFHSRFVGFFPVKGSRNPISDLIVVLDEKLLGC